MQKEITDLTILHSTFFIDTTTKYGAGIHPFDYPTTGRCFEKLFTDYAKHLSGTGNSWCCNID